ncbi:MAG: hypothetical protein Q9228_004832, partial [Teloschistes exilis]
MRSSFVYTFILPWILLRHTCRTVLSTHVESTTLLYTDTPSAPRRRDSDIIPHPLDYAPDFSKDLFPPWPPVTNPDGPNISTENWRGTKIFGWKGCELDDQKILVETFADFHKLASQEALWKNIDWDSAAAKDIWGHATDEKKMLLDNIKPQIKQVFEAVQQIYDKNWWVPPYTPIFEPPWIAWRNLWIRVQCSPDGDENNNCGDKTPPAKKPDCEGGRHGLRPFWTLTHFLADSYAWFAMARYAEKELGRYPSFPVQRYKPLEPRQPGGRRFGTNDDDSVEGVEGPDLTANMGAAVEGNVEANADDHHVPVCQDHPIRQSASLGADTVNDDSKTECDTNNLSGVNYNAFSNGEQTPSIFAQFCQQIDGTLNSRWIVDNHGNPNNPGPGNRVSKRTPPTDIDSYSAFDFELSWEKDTADNGCGHNPESCWNAFTKLIASPCGHQGGDQNGLTATGRITLPGCGAYAYAITGPDMSKTPPSQDTNIPAPPPPAPKSGPPSPPGPAAATDMHTPGCDECLGNLGSSDCKAKDIQCLIDECKNDKSCQE